MCKISVPAVVSLLCVLKPESCDHLVTLQVVNQLLGSYNFLPGVGGRLSVIAGCQFFLPPHYKLQGILPPPPPQKACT